VYYDVAAEGGAAPAETALAALLARDDVKAVIILLPITVQPDVVRAALKAGKHVLSEKPVAPDVAAGATLIAEYRATYMPKGLIWVRARNSASDIPFLPLQLFSAFPQ
jgi:aryl-alcohol dehydrogenase-like predicted oxidoreductase